MGTMMVYWRDSTKAHRSVKLKEHQMGTMMVYWRGSTKVRRSVHHWEKLMEMQMALYFQWDFHSEQKKGNNFQKEIHWVNLKVRQMVTKTVYWKGSTMVHRSEHH